MKVKLKVIDLNVEKIHHLTNTKINVRTNPKGGGGKRKGHENIEISNPVLVNKEKDGQQQYLIYSASGKLYSLGSGTEITVHA